MQCTSVHRSINVRRGLVAGSQLCRRPPAPPDVYRMREGRQKGEMKGRLGVPSGDGWGWVTPPMLVAGRFLALLPALRGLQILEKMQSADSPEFHRKMNRRDCVRTAPNRKIDASYAMKTKTMPPIILWWSFSQPIEWSYFTLKLYIPRTHYTMRSIV